MRHSSICVFHAENPKKSGTINCAQPDTRDLELIGVANHLHESFEFAVENMPTSENQNQN